MIEISELKKVFAGRRVALVGNAKSIFGRCYGAEIDAYDVVVRFNYGEIKSPRDQGRRTDVYGLSDRRIEWEYIESNFHPQVAIWLTPRRISEKLESPYTIPLFRTPVIVSDELLEQTFPGEPSSGLIACNLILRKFEAASIDLYGFDFFSTRTFYHSIKWRFWRKKRMLHNGSNERKLIESWGITIH